MSTITREQLRERAREKVKKLEYAITQSAFTAIREGLEEELELSRIALASLEAEASGRNPVLAYADSYRDMAKQGVESIPVWSVITDLERNIAPLFTTPPAPVSVPDEATPENIEILASTYAPCGVTYQWDRDECNAAADSWNACRAAMLQGADGNSPVIPDGWVACSERMPDEDGNYWGWWSESKRQGPVWFIKSELQAQLQSSEITHWMPLPASPQQEVK